MIILIDAAEALDKIQHPFIIKILIKLGIQENLFKLTLYLHKIYDNTILMKHEILSPKIGSKARMSTSPLQFNIYYEVLRTRPDT